MLKESGPIWNDFHGRLKRIPPFQNFGTISAVRNTCVQVRGLAAALGTRVRIHGGSGVIEGEVIHTDLQSIKVMPYENSEGLAPGMRVDVGSDSFHLYPHARWKGRVIDPWGKVLDSNGPLPLGTQPYTMKASPPPAYERDRLGPVLDLGLRSLNTFIPCCQGQRLGIFAGSGVGKSLLISQMARLSACDVVVIGCVGERGREVKDFLHDHLPATQRENSVIVVGTSDQSALVRRQTAYTTLTVAEYFRDQGASVLCILDSVTRFAMAQREIGLSAGEMPTTRGYPPSVLAELSRLLERAGPGKPGQGSITGFFTVLVEGDDMNEPIADAVRSILDGHIVLDRRIAERARFPAIDVLRSLSRTATQCQTPDQRQDISAARGWLSLYQDMEDLIRMGAYRPGQSADVDQSIAYFEKLEKFLAQDLGERASLAESFAQLHRILHP